MLKMIHISLCVQCTLVEQSGRCRCSCLSHLFIPRKFLSICCTSLFKALFWVLYVQGTHQLLCGNWAVRVQDQSLHGPHWEGGSGVNWCGRKGVGRPWWTLKKNGTGGYFTVTQECGKVSAVILRESGNSSQREGAYGLSFEGKQIARLGRK